MKAKLRFGPIGAMYDASLAEYLRPRRLAYAAFNPKRVTLEPVSAAFCDGAEITFLGDNGEAWPNNKAISQITYTLNPPAREIFDRVGKILGDPVPFMRGGAPYYAGGFANKQAANWIKPGHKDRIINDAFELFRDPIWQEKLKPTFLELMRLETRLAQNGLYLAQKDPEAALIADKPPSTGTGYRGVRTRADAAKAVAKGSMVSVFEHDLDVWGEGQVELWDRWPYEGTWISGFTGFKGTTAGSRSDVDVTACRKNPDGSYTMEVEAMTRGVNITPVSLFATKYTVPRRDMLALLKKYEAPGYEGDPRKALAHVFEAPPCTCNFVTDKVNVGGDFGYTTPPPYTEGKDSDWHLVMPKEVDKSGADGFIGQGSGSIGCTGIFVPEWSSGRLFTRVGYEVLCDHNISAHMARLAVRLLFACSLGDDQNLVVKYEDFPYLINSVLGKHLRLKGSVGNTEFRYGKQCIWTSADHMYVFNMPRAIKSVTSAQSAEVISLLEGEVAELKALPHAIESAAKTWEIAPDVFFMEGNPKEIGQRILSRSYQGMLEDAIIAGAIDRHVATYIGDPDHLAEEIEDI